MKLKNILLQVCTVVGSSMMITSCNDFLDREPLSSTTPEQYFTTVNHFADYSIAKYTGWFHSHGGWSMGIGNGDGGTDNAISGGANRARFEREAWKVPANGGGWNFGDIRYCNYFFATAVPKYEKGLVAGSRDEIEHYIGEMYFMRAWIYFSYLRTFGDFPIIEDVFDDNVDKMIEKSVRQPRNLVARFILNDLDKAIEKLHPWGFAANNRINKQVALLVKSRVALYEASFEKYHKGTGRVPGDANWPGKKLHPNFNTNIDEEVNYFLTEAMEAAETVADNVKLTDNSGVVDPPTINTISGFNPYFEMFASVDLKSIPEVLMWKQYMSSGSFNITHGTPAWVMSGQNNGLLKSYVESFLMKDGKPWYAASTEAPYEGDETLDKVKANRDNRLQIFMFSESNFLPIHSEQKDTIQRFRPHPVANRVEMKDLTGYRLRKYASFDRNQNILGKASSTTGCILFRAVEAYLNYMEASYMLKGRVDEKADKYWKAIRTRAKVNPDYNVTIAATDMSRETDWGKESGGQLVDPTLLNIRRERRCEFIGENMRWNDLVRWRSLDHLLTNKWIPEGCNFWDKMYEYCNVNEELKPITFNHTGENGSNISSPSSSKYLRPYSIMKDNNPFFDGYTFAKANYLSPLPIRQLELLSPDGNIENSVLYQNPYWPTKINGVAVE